MINQNISFQNKSIELFGEESSPRVFYFHLEGDISLIKEWVNEHHQLAIFISHCDWERDFTPYPHEKVFKGGNDFIGEADFYLKQLIGEIIPTLNHQYNLQNKEKVLCGYSLSGLFAIYASTKTNLFSSIIAASSSLWYPSFIDYLKENTSYARDIYLSIGEKESQTKNEVLSKALECQLEAFTLYRMQNKNTILDINPGGHFQDSEERIIKGLEWLIEG